MNTSRSGDTANATASGTCAALDSVGTRVQAFVDALRSEVKALGSNVRVHLPLALADSSAGAAASDDRCCICCPDTGDGWENICCPPCDVPCDCGAVDWGSIPV